jgi:hypothetical protein
VRVVIVVVVGVVLGIVVSVVVALYPLSPDDRQQQIDETWQAELDAYGIKVVRFGGCIVDWDVLARIEGYNDVMLAEIERRFEESLLESTRQKARETHNRVQRCCVPPALIPRDNGK